MATAKKPDPNQELFRPTDVVATITLTVNHVHVTVLPLKPAVPKEYLYALEEALTLQAGHMWAETMKAAGVDMRIKSAKPAKILDHEETRPAAEEE